MNKDSSKINEPNCVFQIDCYSIDNKITMPIYNNDSVKGLIVVDCIIDTLRQRLIYKKLFTTRLIDLRTNKRLEQFDINNIEKESIYYRDKLVTLIPLIKAYIEKVRIIKSDNIDCIHTNRMTIAFRINNK